MMCYVRVTRNPQQSSSDSHCPFIPNKPKAPLVLRNSPQVAPAVPANASLRCRLVLYELGMGNNYL